jgi:hypothetical protein
MLTKELTDSIHINFQTEEDMKQFDELYDFYGEYFIRRLCESISFHSNSNTINYNDFFELYEYNRRLWKIITNYVVIWEESLIANFAKNYNFKKGASKRNFHQNQVKRGEMYVENIELTKNGIKSNFYDYFDESFGVFRAICCNPVIRSEYHYPGFEYLDHIRNIDKLNKYRNNIIHSVFIIIDKNNPKKILNEVVMNKVKIIYQYLPSFHKQSLLKELNEIIPKNKEGIVYKKFIIDLSRLDFDIENDNMKIRNPLYSKALLTN